MAINGQLTEITYVDDQLDEIGVTAATGNMQRGEWYEIRYDANGNVRKAEAINFAIAGDKFVNLVTDVPAAVRDFDTVLLADITTVSKLTFENGTLYTAQTPTDKGFSVSADVKVLLALADKNGKEFDDTEVYTGYTGLEKALREMNAIASYGTMSNGTSYVEVSAILENGSATTIVINDKTPDGNAYNPGTPDYDYTPVVTQNGTFLDIKAHTNDGDGMVTYTAAWNWLTSNGYSVVSATPTTAGGLLRDDYWTFFVNKDGQNTFFQTRLTPMIELTVNGRVGFYNVDEDITNVKGYKWVASGTTTPVASIDGSGNIDIIWGDDGKTLLTELYKVTINGSAAYYQIGDKIELDGSYYTLNGGANTAVPAEGYIKMTTALENATIVDDLFLVNVAGETEYVKKGSATTGITALTNNSYLYDSLNKQYVEVSSNQIANVQSDITVLSKDAYYKVTGITVNQSNASNMGVMSLSASINGGVQYIEATDTVTVDLALALNGSTGATGDVKAQITATGATVATADGYSVAKTIIDQGTDADALATASIAVTLRAFTAKDVSLTLTLSNG